MTSFFYVCVVLTASGSMSLLRVKRPSRRVLSQATALCLCLLCPSGVAIVEDSRCCVQVCKVLSEAEFVQQPGYRTVGWWIFGLLRWLLQLTITTHTTITATKGCVSEARMWHRYHRCPHDPLPGGCYHSCVAKTEKCNLGFNIQCSE